MALSIVKELLQQYVQSLLKEGFVNDQFCQNRTSKSLNEQHDSVEQWINKYCTDIETILLELNHCSELPDVDFSQVTVLAKQVEEESLRFGAEYVRLASANLIRACDQMHKKSFSRTLRLVKDEFARTRNKLQPVIQMERKMIRLEAKQKEERSPNANF